MKWNIIWVLVMMMVGVTMGASDDKGKKGNYIKSTSLLTCMENSLFTASHFDVVFYPDSGKVFSILLLFLILMVRSRHRLMLLRMGLMS